MLIITYCGIVDKIQPIQYAAEFLITGLGGITILEPGCTKLGVSPYESSEPYTVVYPTPRGDVVVTWDGTTAKVDAPVGVEIVSLSGQS